MDYEKIGLKAGLEIHQQIDSRKLFCSCPSAVRDDPPDVVVERKLRASAGESGEVDVAAAHEQRKEKRFVYHAYTGTTCLVELDEEPIHLLNEDALGVVLQVAALARAKVVDRIAVMRKTVVDGSNTSGFQRTALVARDGMIKTSTGPISIPTICIEEESAKVMERSSEQDVYNLSRLGIPLVEIATGADIRTPQQLKEVAEHIGMMLRSTGRVKRGLGTIRQDVNVSIRGGARVEIKGAQELKLLPRLVEVEAQRQVQLLQLRDLLSERKAVAGGKPVDITPTVKHSPSKLLQTALKGSGAVVALKLEGFKGLVGKEISPGRRFGKELSEYARVAAGVGGAVHIDELPAYGISEEDVAAIAKKLGCGSSDAFIFVADKKEKAERAIAALAQRARQALHGVPSEVRKANPDGTTTFLRPMPGAARMYPETDTTTVTPDISSVVVPELRSSKAERYEAMGLGRDLAAALVNEEKDGLFDRIMAGSKNLKPAFVAETLISYTPELLRLHKGLDPLLIKEKQLTELFSALNSAAVAKESVMAILADVAKAGKLDISRYKVLSEAELESALKKIVAAHKDLPFNALIGMAMAELRGKADGRVIVGKLKKIVGS